MQSFASGPRVVRFALGDLEEQVAAFASRFPAAVVDAAGLGFVVPGEARLRLPLAGLRPLPGESAAAYGARLPAPPERQVVVLLRAGAVAIGYWDGGELLRHKAERRYVVRGSGKAQPTHLRTRGKSRHGSRLRLRNWQRLLGATNARLRSWWEELGAPDRVFLAAPVRVCGDLLAAAPPPPFRRGAPELQRIPMHVHRPDHAELLRVRAWCCHGRLELHG